MESNYNLLSENQFGEVVVFAPLIRVPRNATSCPRVSCQESKTFSCYSSGGGVLIPLAEETVGAGPIVPSAILFSPDSSFPLAPSSSQHGPVCASRADTKAPFLSLWLSQQPRQLSSFQFPRTPHYLLFPLCARSNCHHIKRTMRKQAPCLPCLTR